MKYYDSKGNLVELKKSKTFVEGTNGIVYKVSEDIAYKEYILSGDTIISQAMFEFLKSIDNPNFIRLIERYYQTSKVEDYDFFLKSISDTTPIEDIRNSDTFRIDAYTYYWIKEEFVDLLEEDKEYILYNISSLLKLADFLASNNVGLADTKTENSVCNKNNIVLIDPDMYYFIPTWCRTDLCKKNRLRILYLMSSLCRSKTKHISYETSDKVTELFADSIKTPNKAEKILSKKLRGYRKPIDYLKR